jgi:hypothetical protein
LRLLDHNPASYQVISRAPDELEKQSLCQRQSPVRAPLLHSLPPPGSALTGPFSRRDGQLDGPNRNRQRAVAIVEVHHRPRRFGRSKYGLSRICKVLLDLVAIKTLLVFARRPLFWFVGAASLAALVSVLCLIVAVAYAIAPDASPTMVFIGMSMPAGSLAVFLALIGMIGYLVFQRAGEISAIGPMVRRLPGGLARGQRQETV